MQFDYKENANATSNNIIYTGWRKKRPEYSHALCSKLLTDFWPTVLSVAPLLQHVVCLSVCNVLYCGETVHPGVKVSITAYRKSYTQNRFLPQL